MLPCLAFMYSLANMSFCLRYDFCSGMIMPQLVPDLIATTWGCSRRDRDPSPAAVQLHAWLGAFSGGDRSSLRLWRAPGSIHHCHCAQRMDRRYDHQLAAGEPRCVKSSTLRCTNSWWLHHKIFREPEVVLCGHAMSPDKACSAFEQNCLHASGRHH